MTTFFPYFRICYPEVFLFYHRSQFLICYSIDRFNYTQELIPRSTDLLEKLIVAQLVKKFPALYWSRKFITVIRRACKSSSSWTSWIQSTHSHIFSLWSRLILPSTLHLSPPSGLIPSGISTELLYACYISRPLSLSSGGPRVQVRVTLRLTVSHSVRLGLEPLVGLITITVLVIMKRPLWREDEFVSFYFDSVGFWRWCIATWII